jgi:hypothetical protein
MTNKDLDARHAFLIILQDKCKQDAIILEVKTLEI